MEEKVYCNKNGGKDYWNKSGGKGLSEQKWRKRLNGTRMEEKV